MQNWTILWGVRAEKPTTIMYLHGSVNQKHLKPEVKFF